MRVLVTGGAGYIGSVVVEHLVAAGADVTVFDNLSQGHRQAVHPGARFVLGDLADRAAIDRVLDDTTPDGIMHFAAYSLVGESMQNPMKYLRDNLVCGLNLMESAVHHGVGSFILSSTANLFSEPAQVPIAESECVVPGSPYGESKHMLERSLVWMETIYGLRHTCLRYFNACGATAERGEHHQPEVHLIPLILQVAQGRRPNITIFGDDYPTTDGTCVRDYVHVSDLASAHILALRALLAGGSSKTYNLGSGQGYSVKEIIAAARAITGHPIPTVIGPRRAGDPARLIASSAAIERELGWKRAFSGLHEILETAWQWHFNHPDGYDSPVDLTSRARRD
jgi:UDP-glucose 4-epimerase